MYTGAGYLQQDYLQIRVLELRPRVYVSGQLFEQDVKLLAKQGVRSILNNRADGEVPGQPLSDDLARVAEEHGVTYLQLAVDPRSITERDVRAFAKACHQLERPLHVFSRSGARSMKIWEMAEAMSLDL